MLMTRLLEADLVFDEIVLTYSLLFSRDPDSVP